MQQSNVTCFCVKLPRHTQSHLSPLVPRGTREKQNIVDYQLNQTAMLLPVLRAWLLYSPMYGAAEEDPEAASKPGAEGLPYLYGHIAECLAYVPCC